MLLEIAVFNPESAVIAANAGADRLELCHDMTVGGLTPDAEIIRLVKAQVACPFFVMIRPKVGDFVYSKNEIETMKQDLLAAKANGAAGFVFGIMQENGEIDTAANKELVALAYPLPCTFHRAFDAIEDKEEALETLIHCGFQRVLTSCGVGNAIDFAKELSKLIIQANGRIIVMPGGGVRSGNIAQLLETTMAAEYHSAAITDHSPVTNAAEVAALKSRLF